MSSLSNPFHAPCIRSTRESRLMGNRHWTYGLTSVGKTKCRKSVRSFAKTTSANRYANVVANSFSTTRETGNIVPESV